MPSKPTSKVNTLFWTAKERKLYHGYGRSHVENWIGQIFKLYRVDKVNTTSHELYGEAKTKEFLEPIDVSGRVFISEEEVSLESGVRRYSKGDLICHVYIEHLQELDISIETGDFIEWNGRWYSVYDHGKGHVGTPYLIEDKYYHTILASQSSRDKFEAR
jgi:hypothetical protein